ncbi:hypothetical protein GFC01_17155 [Desulfofundulus thermobenzoicus]|uniref:Uncharacterized protein n=1 Tax=Desulfofundulus thermobenzoicus TaxID=29376 RepID=A0A6N7IWG6_9FIRM|nr:hypothetical protein [Desulfofundulus thermobenzoicus]MQL53953.1 hypothetical protein [Desulfofundulus thermobenzoicus]HHW44961.1 hypothetical protein [Desulfotomaculum sp.]
MARKTVKQTVASNTGPVIVETAQGENIDHLVARVKTQLLWVVASSVVAFGLGLLAGNLIKF